MELTSTTPASPEPLLHAARNGDGAARGRLLEMYRNYLLLLARFHVGRRLQGKLEPADLVQETFLDAHRHFAGFRGNSEPEFVGWLRQILAGTLAYQLRRYLGTRQRDPRRECDLAAELDRSSRELDAALLAGGASPSQQAARREQAVLLADALQRLPPDCREVIVLRHLEGLPFAEVAQRMGRSLDVVKKLWPRALTRLRDLMGGAA
jgi:RNA polymerase sigma-70 factor (ECF subfamily)